MQCINFAIAYVILTRFIFKPVLICIMEERERRKALHDAISVFQKNINDLEAKRITSWEKAKNLFGVCLKKIPRVYRVKPSAYQYEYESASDAQVRAYAEKVHDAIMKKVSQDVK